MPVRTGQQYLAGLEQMSREVWLEGQRVRDIGHHPAFERPISHLAGLYDLQNDPRYRDTLTYKSPKTGDRVATSFMIPQTTEDLRKRRDAFDIVARKTFGLLGRSPDFVNTTLAAFADAGEFFAEGGAAFAKNVVAYYEHARENDIFLTHALTHPQSDRSRSSADQAEEFLHLGVVRETADGLIVQGARMLATMGPIADDVLVYNLPGLKAGEEKYAIAFAVPISTPGIRQIARKPYHTSGDPLFDHPLSVNFEETDSLLIFDNVLIPWDRVFLYGNVDLANRLYAESAVRQHTAHQTAVRGLVKLQLAVGIVMSLADAIRASSFLHVQEMMGECVNYIETIKSCIVRSEVEYERTPSGAIRPNLAPLQAIRLTLSKVYPRVIEIMQTIGAGGLLMTPSSEDFGTAIQKDVEKYYQGVGKWSSEERTRLFRLAWDLCGDAFGARALQYERYYAGDPVRLKAMTYMSYDRTELDSLVSNALDLGRETQAGGEPAQKTLKVGR